MALLVGGLAYFPAMGVGAARPVRRTGRSVCEGRGRLQGEARDAEGFVFGPKAAGPGSPEPFWTRILDRFQPGWHESGMWPPSGQIRQVHAANSGSGLGR